ncbi:hypothetical protein FACHB389_04165 [Nostoc calcicola FACHB-389]|nr:hypothetical protein FACHB389_04165 [Nostoc calcicola FACHB-389]
MSTAVPLRQMWFKYMKTAVRKKLEVGCSHVNQRSFPKSLQVKLEYCNTLVERSSYMPEQLPNRNEFLDSRWKICRDLIQHEDNLINHRMTWLISSNFFLFSAFFVIFNSLTPTPTLTLTQVVNKNQHLAEIFSLLIPLIGIAICWTVWQLVRAATGQVDNVNTWWNRQLEKYLANNKNYPSLIGQSKYNSRDWKNIYSILPFIMTVAWVMLLCVSLTKGFKPGTFSYGLITLVAIALLFYIGLFLKGNLSKRKQIIYRNPI